MVWQTPKKEGKAEDPGKHGIINLQISSNVANSTRKMPRKEIKTTENE